jgi:signal transduction histidine kinase
MITGYIRMLSDRFGNRWVKPTNTLAVDGTVMQRPSTICWPLPRQHGKTLKPRPNRSAQRVSNPVRSETNRDVTFDPPGDSGDDVRLAACSNLISNALKFQRGEPPRIHVAARRQEKRWLFSVKDNGIGIEPDCHEKIFEIFTRLHSRSDFTGTGIGLATCKKIVEQHSGKIWVESVVGQGSTFYFTLPIAEMQEMLQG